jgi:hypothetical protein
MKIKIEGKSYDTDGMQQVLDYQGEVSPGILLEGAWKNSNNEIIVIYYSIWDRGDGCHRGYYGIIADKDFIQALKHIYKMKVED